MTHEHMNGSDNDMLQHERNVTIIKEDTWEYLKDSITFQMKHDRP